MNKYWNPPRFGEKLENEVVCYTVAVPNLALPWHGRKALKASEKLLDFVKNQSGFVGIRTEYPRGTLLIYKTENDAKIARNEIKAMGCPVGNNICEVFIDKMYVDTK